MCYFSSFTSFAKEGLNLLKFWLCEVGDLNIDLYIKISLLIWVVNWHAFLFNNLHKTWLSDLVSFNHDIPAVQVLNRSFKA